MSHYICRGASAGFALSAILMLSWGLAAPGPAGAAAPASDSRSGAQPGHVMPEQGPSSNYIIGPGDELRVFVWQNPDLSVTVPVRPDGRISTPLVQNMVAVGKTPAQLAHDMERVLATYLRSPTVNIIVTQPLGELSEVKVVGEVMHPEAIPFHEGMRVLDVVLAAGGLTQYAAGNRASIVRSVKGGTRKIRVNLGRLINKGDMSQNLLIQPGDVLVVPQTLF